jgi:hypothetical protein
MLPVLLVTFPAILISALLRHLPLTSSVTKKTPSQDIITNIRRALVLRTTGEELEQRKLVPIPFPVHLRYLAFRYELFKGLHLADRRGQLNFFIEVRDVTLDTGFVLFLQLLNAR